MELGSSKDDENKKTLEASAVENNTEDNDREVAEDTDKNEKNFGKTLLDANQEEKALEALVEENNMASKEADFSEMKTPRAARAKTKVVKRRLKSLVKGKTKAGTSSVKEADVEDVTNQQGTSEGANQNLSPASNEEGEKGGGNDEEVKKVIEGSAEDSQPLAGDGADAEPSVWGNVMEVVKVIESSAEAPQPSADGEKVSEADSSVNRTPKRLKEETKVVKTHLKRIQKGKTLEATLSSHGEHQECETMLHGTKEGMNLDMDMNDAEVSLGRDEKEVEKVIEDSVESHENVKSEEKKASKRLKAKAKIRKAPTKQIAEDKTDSDAPEIQENDLGNRSNSLGGSGEGKSIEKLISPEVKTSERTQLMSVEKNNKQDESAQEKTDLAEDGKQIKKRQRKRVLGANKKPKSEPVSADAKQQGLEESEEKPVVPEKKESSGNKKAKLGGLIFMCNAKTKPDCFRFRVMGVSEKKKDFVMDIKPGLKLFLYDYDLKLLYGIFQASSPGCLKLERKAFGGSFPAQVRFKVFRDCNPLPESIFRKAIKENYNNNNKFKTELTLKQVLKLGKLFRPAAVPSTIQLPQPVPVSRGVDGKRSDRDRNASGSSRTRSTHRHDRGHVHGHVHGHGHGHEHRASPPRREEPRDFYLTEREYRELGLRRGQTSQHYSIPPPPDSHLTVGRDPVALDAYHPDLDRDRDRELLLLRHADIESHHRREAHYPDRLYLPPGRDYLGHDHRHELLTPLPPQNPTNPPLSAAALDSYGRDLYYSHDYRAPIAERSLRAYLSSPGRDDALYLRYATADSLAEYYRTRRYPGMADPALPPPSVASRYPYSGSSSYPYR